MKTAASPSEEEFILLYSGKIGEKIACLLKGLILDKFPNISHVETRDTRFDIDNPENSSVDFLSNMKLLIEENSAKPCAMVITGGYKILSDFSYLLASIYRLPIYYKQEKMSKIMKLPPLPVNWDFFRLLNEITKIRAGKENSFNLLEVIGEKVDELRDSFHYREPLVSKISNPKYRAILNAAIPIWSHLWIGDQIPETVEHSKNHSKRILERFQYLLEQDEDHFWEALALREAEQKDDFLFILVAAAYLHDIGHTILSIPIKSHGNQLLLLKNLPDIVRRFHHVFTVYLLESHRTFLRLESLSPDLWDALCLVCLYHREEMPLAKPIPDLSRVKKEPKNAEEYTQWQKHYERTLLNEFLCSCFDTEYKPLVKQERFERLERPLKKICLQVAALLKIFDEMDGRYRGLCDVQSDRVVDSFYKEVRSFRTEEEIKILQATEKNSRLEKNEPPLAYELYKQLSENWEVEKDVEIASIISFKQSQKDHFDKHSEIEAVLPVIDKNILQLCVKGAKSNRFKEKFLKQTKLVEEDQNHLPPELADILLFPYDSQCSP